MSCTPNHEVAQQYLQWAVAILRVQRPSIQLASNHLFGSQNSGNCTSRRLCVKSDYNCLHLWRILMFWTVNCASEFQLERVFVLNFVEGKYISNGCFHFNLIHALKVGVSHKGTVSVHRVRKNHWSCLMKLHGTRIILCSSSKAWATSLTICKFQQIEKYAAPLSKEAASKNPCPAVPLLVPWTALECSWLISSSSQGSVNIDK
jgi:hypothetical protein